MPIYVKRIFIIKSLWKYNLNSRVMHTVKMAQNGVAVMGLEPGTAQTGVHFQDSF